MNEAVGERARAQEGEFVLRERTPVDKGQARRGVPCWKGGRYVVANVVSATRALSRASGSV